MGLSLSLNVFPSVFTCFAIFLTPENALERDHFMTGTSESARCRLVQKICRQITLLMLTLTAQEALEFGIVDGILEKSPKSDSDMPSTA
jgi:hypothetical protein